MAVEPGPHAPGLDLAAQDGDLQRRQALAHRVAGAVAGAGGVAEGQDPLRAPVQGAQLQGLHDPGQLLAAGAARAQVAQGVDAQVDVGDEPVEAAVAHHVVEVLAQRGPRPAPDLPGVGDDAVQAVVEVEPLGRGLGPHARHPAQVVAGLAHQRRQVRVALGAHAVALLHLGGRHAPRRGAAPDGLEHGAVLGDELEGVAVAGAHQDLQVLGLGPRGQGGQDVVRLVVRGRHGAHPHRRQEVLDELDLPDEGLGRLVAVGLVVGVLAGAEGAARQVEGDGQVGGPLLLQQGQEHGDEAVHGVGRLAGGGGEGVHGQRVVGPEGHGVSVDEQQAPRPGGDGRGIGVGWAGLGGAHRASLRA